jgi:hypothetical protein
MSGETPEQPAEHSFELPDLPRVLTRAEISEGNVAELAPNEKVMFDADVQAPNKSYPTKVDDGRTVNFQYNAFILANGVRAAVVGTYTVEGVPLPPAGETPALKFALLIENGRGEGGAEHLIPLVTDEVYAVGRGQKGQSSMSDFVSKHQCDVSIDGEGWVTLQNKEPLNATMITAKH